MGKNHSRERYFSEIIRPMYLVLGYNDFLIFRTTKNTLWLIHDETNSKRKLCLVNVFIRFDALFINAAFG